MSTKAPHYVKEVLLGAMVSAFISIVGYAFFFNSSYAALQSEVKNNSDNIKKFVPRDEHNKNEAWQQRYDQEMTERFNRLETKVDNTNDKINDVLKILAEKGK